MACIAQLNKVTFLSDLALVANEFDTFVRLSPALYWPILSVLPDQTKTS